MEEPIHLIFCKISLSWQIQQPTFRIPVKHQWFHNKTTTTKQLTHVFNCWVQDLQDKNKKNTCSNHWKHTHKEPLKYFSVRTTSPDIMQSIFELKNATTNFSNTNDTSMISQSTIPGALSPSTKLNILTILPTYILSHWDTDAILNDSNKITESSQKQIQQISRPVVKLKQIDKKLNNGIVSFQIKTAVTYWSYSESTTKLIRGQWEHPLPHHSMNLLEFEPSPLPNLC